MATLYTVLGTVIVGAIAGTKTVPPPSVVAPFFAATHPELHISRPLGRQYTVTEIPYTEKLFGLNTAITAGAATLTKLIEETPGPFAMLGISQGAAVISNVYDQIRQGTLKNRSTDFVMGVALANPRRQKGSSWGAAAPMCPNGRGILDPNLAGVDSRWWEWSIAAGTYPTATGTVTFPRGDAVSCLGDDDLGYWTRQIAALAGAASTPFNAASLLKLLVAPWRLWTLINAASLLYSDLFAKKSPHINSYFTVAPTGGDTFWQIMLDALNRATP